MLKELGNAISIDEKKKIKEDFQETLLSFFETVLLNGARRGNEWNCAIFGLKGAAGWCAVRRWSEDRTLPDGQVGAATGRKVAKLSEGSHIEVGDKYGQSRIKWIHTFQDWITYSQENGGTPEKTAQYGITRSNVRIWLLNNKFTFQEASTSRQRQPSGPRPHPEGCCAGGGTAEVAGI